MHAGSAVRGVSFDVHAGEIVGLGGLVGAGRTEVVVRHRHERVRHPGAMPGAGTLAGAWVQRLDCPDGPHHGFGAQIGRQVAVSGHGEAHVERGACVVLLAGKAVQDAADPRAGPVLAQKPDQVVPGVLAVIGRTAVNNDGKLGGFRHRHLLNEY